MNIVTYLSTAEVILGSREDNDYPCQVRQVTCKDGFHVSVQASCMHYCRPRNNVGPWTHVELGYPSHEVPAYIQAFGYEDSPVYAAVPVELVDKMIVSHGGIDLEAS